MRKNDCCAYVAVETNSSIFQFGFYAYYYLLVDRIIGTIRLEASLRTVRYENWISWVLIVFFFTSKNHYVCIVLFEIGIRRRRRRMTSFCFSLPAPAVRNNTLRINWIIKYYLCLSHDHARIPSKRDGTRASGNENEKYKKRVNKINRIVYAFFFPVPRAAKKQYNNAERSAAMTFLCVSRLFKTGGWWCVIYNSTYIHNIIIIITIYFRFYTRFMMT